MTRYLQLKTALEESQSWYTRKQLCETLGVASSDASTLLKRLEEEGAAQRLKSPNGFAQRAQWIFAAVGVEPPEGAGLPPKLKGFRVEAREAKRTSRAAGKATPVVALPPGVSLESRFARRGGAALPPGAPRWAFTSDGTFALLDGGIELTDDQASALVCFVGSLAGRQS